MTYRAYFDETNPLECEATVLECVAKEDKFEILLDRTVIFPESGGQLSDVGTIGSAVVSHARESGEDVWHMSDRPIKVGARVKVTANAEARLDHSQQHTGEHILSGTAHAMYGVQNVGFHMAEDYVTIDLDGYLDEKQLSALELRANEAVWADVPTEYRHVTADEIESIPLRKHAKGLTGDIRIVYCGGVDSCTCCGTHTARSGQVGQIKLTAAIKYKGGVRIWFACGKRALADAVYDKAITDALARRFSAKREDILHSVLKQGDELTSAKRELKERTECYLALVARSLAGDSGGYKWIMHREDGLSMQEVKVLAEKLTATGFGVAVTASVREGSVYYALMRAPGDKHSMKELIAAMNPILCGKGGGKESMAQGNAPVRSETELRDSLETLRCYFERVLA